MAHVLFAVVFCTTFDVFAVVLEIDVVFDALFGVVVFADKC